MERAGPCRGGSGIVMRYAPIESLLPHRAPMILLDEVHDASERSITCRIVLRADSPFVEHGRVPALVTVEYMAQCVAAYAGLQASHQGRAVRIGYIIGVRFVDFSVEALHVGEEILVKATRVWGDDALGNFECSVDSGGHRAAEGVFTVYQGDIGHVPAGGTASL